MLLGQAGFRYTKFINRWTLSNDMKFFGGHVYQSQSTSRQEVQATYAAAPAVGVVSLTDNNVVSTFHSGIKNERSTIGFDLRVEGAYKASKYLDVRGGFAMLYFARGIWRGRTSREGGEDVLGPNAVDKPNQNQNLVMPAFTFGVALNR